jgi:hypothetical protein
MLRHSGELKTGIQNDRNTAHRIVLARIHASDTCIKKYKDRRYHNQASVFSCPAEPYEPLDVDVLENLESLIVPRTLKPALRERLRMLGVSASFIDPGLDGVAAEVKSLQYDPVHTGRQRVISFKSVLDFGSHVTQGTLEKDKTQTPD